MRLHAMGIELGRNFFHLVALDSKGQVVIRKRCSRMQMLAFTASVDVQMIGIQACETARSLGCVLREQGHQVCLISARDPNSGQDCDSAEAIAEAARLACSNALDVCVPLDRDHDQTI
jgi:transposase